MKQVVKIFIPQETKRRKKDEGMEREIKKETSNQMVM
jgi:hypothetical protein